MPGVGFHYWNDARNKPGGVTGIGPNPNQYNSFLDVFHNKGSVFYSFDYPEVFAIPSNTLSGMFSSVTLPDNIVLQLLNNGDLSDCFINMITSGSASDILIGAQLIQFENTSTGQIIDLTRGLAFSQSNFLVNGNFDIWQRGTSFNTTGYGADRWFFAAPSTDFTFSRQSGSPATGSQFYGRVQRANLSVNTSGVSITQALESNNAILYQNNRVSLSFLARCGSNYSSAGNGLTVQIASGTGTDQRYASFTGQGFLANTSVTLTTSWSLYTVNGITTTGTELGVFFGYTPTGTAGANDYFEVSQVMFTQGIGAVFNPSSVQQELSSCQRYFRRFNTVGNTFQFIMPGQAFSTTAAILYYSLQPNMRKLPLLTQKGNLQLTSNTAGVLPVTSLSINAGQSDGNTVRLDAGVAAGLAAGNITILQANNDATGDVFLDAEL